MYFVNSRLGVERLDNDAILSLESGSKCPSSLISYSLSLCCSLLFSRSLSLSLSLSSPYLYRSGNHFHPPCPQRYHLICGSMLSSSPLGCVEGHPSLTSLQRLHTGLPVLVPKTKIHLLKMAEYNKRKNTIPPQINSRYCKHR